MLYKEIVSLYSKLDNTSKRLEKTSYIAEIIRKSPAEDIQIICLMAQGKIFPDWDDKKIGVASKLVIKAISKATLASPEKIEEEWKRLGDLGDVTEYLIKKKKQASLFPRELELSEVYNNLRNLAEVEGKGSVDDKADIISEMLIHATPEEAKYIVRTALDNLRVGIGKGSIRDSIVWAFFGESLGIKYNKEANDIELTDEKREEYNMISDKIQHAYDLTNEFGLVAMSLKKDGLAGLDKLKLTAMTPVNVMLFQKAESISDAFSIVGTPCALEFKYDGFRMQVHKDKSGIKIFTRRLEDVSEQFPDVMEALKKNILVQSCILEGEAVGIDLKTGRYVAFQSISQRIKRKYDIKELSEKFPVELNLFDIISYNGDNLINEPFKKRRDLLEKAVKEEKTKIAFAKQIITSDETVAKKFYEESLKSGEEGLMAKSLDGIYKPGSRVGYGVKIKPIMEPLDLVIIGAEYGEGKRSGWFSSFSLACQDNGEFLEIGKVSTGLKELESEGTSFSEMTTLLKPFIMKTDGKEVILKPEVVIEVAYEEIQKSQSYSSGYALRFPRFLRLRNDEKSSSDANSIDDVERLFRNQRGRATV
jgi:DNA ligase-1